jgi:hypothetical protein
VASIRPRSDELIIALNTSANPMRFSPPRAPESTSIVSALQEDSLRKALNGAPPNAAGGAQFQGGRQGPGIPLRRGCGATTLVCRGRRAAGSTRKCC